MCFNLCNFNDLQPSRASRPVTAACNFSPDKLRSNGPQFFNISGESLFMIPESLFRNRKYPCRQFALPTLVVALTFLLTIVAGCASGDGSLEAVDPDTVSADPSWDRVFSIIQRDCTPCHDDDFPPYVTCEDVIAAIDDLYEDVFIKNSMPPGAWPRLTSEEKLAIQRWIDNGMKAPCTDG